MKHKSQSMPTEASLNEEEADAVTTVIQEDAQDLI